MAVTSPPATKTVTLTIDGKELTGLNGGGAEARPHPRPENPPEDEPEPAPRSQRPPEPE